MRDPDRGGSTHMSKSEQDRRDWPSHEDMDGETGSEPTPVTGEPDTLDEPAAPEPSWRPEAPAWDRPVPRSKPATMPVGGPMDTTMAPTPTRPSSETRSTSTGRSRTPGRGTTAGARKSTARKPTARKSTKRVAAGKKAAAARKRKTAPARKAAARKSTARKSTARKSTARKSTARKSTARK